jgi:hypothetical protein
MMPLLPAGLMTASFAWTNFSMCRGSASESCSGGDWEISAVEHKVVGGDNDKK